MLILISCAKTMSSGTNIVPPYTTTPLYNKDAENIIESMKEYSPEELSKVLKTTKKIAQENISRYQNFNNQNTRIPAILSYTGIVFKRINPHDFTKEDFDFAQKHLRITSFAYGLLKPLDLINNYRLEGSITPKGFDKNLFNYWKSKLTDILIKDVKEQGGELYNLASSEMKNLFNWKKVEKEVKIITPEFKTWHNGEMRTIVVYTKIARGETTREIIKNKIQTASEIL